MTLQVFDADEKKMIEINEDKRRLAATLHQQVAIGVFISALALKRIRDEKLYLALNCQSFNEYLLSMSPISKSQAYIFIKIAEKFERYLPKEGVHTGGQLPGEMEQFGIKKLYELARLEEEEFTQITKTGMLQLPDGSQLTVEEIKDMTLREFKEEMKKFKEARDKYQSKIAQLDEENKTLAEEKNILKKELEEKEARLAELKELEAKYGARAGKLEEKRAALQQASQALTDLEQHLFQVNADVEDPLTLQRELVDFIRRIDMTVQNAQSIYAEVITNQA